MIPKPLRYETLCSQLMALTASFITLSPTLSRVKFSDLHQLLARERGYSAYGKCVHTLAFRGWRNHQKMLVIPRLDRGTSGGLHLSVDNTQCIKEHNLRKFL